MINSFIENWSICTIPSPDPLAPPECSVKILCGDVYNHPKFKDGTYVQTSMTIGVRDGKILTHSGSMYELGDVDTEYEEQYPNAKERLLNTGQ